MSDAHREIGKWLNEEPNRPVDLEALAELCADYDRLCDRIERLRGLCKSASGWLLDAGDVEHSDIVLGLVGDMESTQGDDK